MGAIDTLTTDQQLEAIYLGYFGRAADGDGFGFWEGQYTMATASGQSADQALTNIANSFEPQPETVALYPFLANPAVVVGSQGSAIITAEITSLIDSIYQNLFARTPPAGDAGVAYWLGQLQTGAVGLGQVILDIANGATGADVTTLVAKITAADFFTTQTTTAGLGLTAPLSAAFHAAAVAAGQDVTASGSVTASEAATTAFIAGTPTGPTFTLTTGIDSGATFTTAASGAVFNAPVGQNPVTLAPADTLNTGDILTDTGASGVLTATLIAGSQTPTITGIATYALTNSVAAAATLGGAMTGVTTINNVGSLGNMLVGTSAVPLAGAVTTVGASNTSTALLITEATAALAGAADALTINANTVGSAGAAGVIPVFATVSIGDGATNGVEGWTVHSTNSGAGANFLQLGASGSLAPLATASSATSLVVNGSAPVVLAADGATDFGKLVSIDAHTSGGVWVSGAADNTTGAYAWGSAGVLTADTSLTSFLGGAGSNLLDISNLTTAAAVNAVAISDAASTSTTNTVVLNNSVVTGSVALTNMTDVQVIGDTAPSGTVNWSFMPASAVNLTEYGVQTASLTINNAPSTFTLETLGNDSGAFAITVNAATVGSTAFTLDLGNASYITTGVAANQYDDTSVITTLGYATNTLVSNGTAMAYTPGALTTDGNVIASVSMTSTGGAPIALDISGAANLFIDGAINLVGNGVAINDTDTGVVMINFGSPTNAAQINAGTSGGLLMGDNDVGNAGVNGVSITGSTTAGNFLIGSLGNDNIKGGAASDTIATNGGGDTITLAAGHHNDAIDLMTTIGPATTAGVVPGADGNNIDGAATITSTTDVAQPGFWGVAPGTTPTATVATLFTNGTGTSADNTTIAGFIAGSGGTADHVSFAPSEWGHAGAVLGLTAADLATTLTSTSAVLLTQVASGGTVGSAATDLIVLTGETFTNASQLAANLANGTFSLNFAGTGAVGKIAHVLIAYNDTTSSTRVADVDITESGTSASAAHQTNIAASDIVTLTGVTDTALTTNNVHFV